MKCKCCGKEIDPVSSWHCPGCVSDYCEDCARSMGICACYSGLERYS